jgi:hypothetical protein
MEDEMSVPRILALVEAEWHRFDRAAAAIPPGEASAVKVVGEWTVKDIIAHVTAWEQRLLSWLEAAARGEAPTNADPIACGQEVDTWNARVHARNKDRPLAEIRAEAQRTHRDLVRMLVGIPSDPNNPWWSLWPPDLTPWDVIAANTYDHYPEHLLAIESRFGTPNRDE